MTRITAALCGELELSPGEATGYGVGYDGALYISTGSRVMSISPSGSTEAFDLDAGRLAIHFVQPMPDGFLVVQSRSSAGDPNGLLFGFDGKPTRALALGDGIEDVQTTDAGTIWVSYFDEGVFNSESLGGAGLRQVDSEGHSLYEFSPSAGLDAIDDCYALNVTSNDEVWCYYYSQFPIVRIESRHVAHHWSSPISGAHALCVWGDSVLLQGGYDSRIEWPLLKLGNAGLATVIETFEFTAGGGQVLEATYARARGDALWFIEGRGVYRVSLRELLN